MFVIKWRKITRVRLVKSCLMILGILVIWIVHLTYFLPPTKMNLDKNVRKRNIDYKLMTSTLPNANLLMVIKNSYTNKKKPLQYVYHCPFSPTFKGKPFHPDQYSLSSVGFPLDDFVSLTDSVLENFVFVTAASERFSKGLINAVASIQKYFPKRKIIVYDLGLAKQTLFKINQLCDVTIKKLNFELYPSHIDQLFLYAWKPLLIHDVLKDYTGVFWIDSSGRMTSGNMTKTYKDIKRTHGIILFRNTGHSNYAVTHAQMYHYIPSRPSEMKRTQQREANSILVYRTREVYSAIIFWWTLCALERKCISPTDQRFCSFEDNWNKYANCHRFDQSAINTLLANYFDFNDSFYKSTEEILTIKRGFSYKRYKGDNKPKICDK